MGFYFIAGCRDIYMGYCLDFDVVVFDTVMFVVGVRAGFRRLVYNL